MKPRRQAKSVALQCSADLILLCFIIERLRVLAGPAGESCSGPENIDSPIPATIDDISAGMPELHPHDGGLPSAHERSPEQSPPVRTLSLRQRFLCVDAPERVPLGGRLSVHVQVTLDRPPMMRTEPFEVEMPPAGAGITITVSAPGLVPTGDLELDLHIPVDADSDPIRFGFIADRAGLHRIVVRAFRGGTFLGSLATQLSVQTGAMVEESHWRVAALEDLTPEPGEVTLVVTRTEDDCYVFQLRGEGIGPLQLSEHLAGDPSRVVNMIVEELRLLAAGDSPYRSAKLQRAHLRNLGVSLWADAVPAAIRHQFWSHVDHIKSFTVISDDDVVPWELLYPLDGQNDRGFLVEQFPVVRRVTDQRRAKTLPVRSAAYIVPSDAPTNARAEVELIRHRLSDRISRSTVIDQFGDLLTLLDASPGLLHFVCHNDFTDEKGSVVLMDDGPFRPVDLAVVAQTAALATASPLVFFNACRTAGQIPGLLTMMGWAQQFMAAGAGAFVGSLWAVRSSSARAFADAFYDYFVVRRLPLGQAAMAARRHIAADEGDPTWLAYTVYGNTAATVSDEDPAGAAFHAGGLPSA